MKYTLCYEKMKGIPINEIIKAVNIMEYASTERVTFQLLTLLGCRIQELDTIKFTDIYPYNSDMYIVYWKKGKNQKGNRSELIPNTLYNELVAYRENHKVLGKHLLGAKGQTFCRYFNRDIRPKLGGQWLTKEPNPENAWREEYIYQIKGLRKTFVTFSFKKYYEKWKNPDMALEQISKQMGHKTKRMTSMHYLQETEPLGIDSFYNRYINFADIIRDKERQSRLIEYIT